MFVCVWSRWGPTFQAWARCLMTEWPGNPLVITWWAGLATTGGHITHSHWHLDKQMRGKRSVDIKGETRWMLVSSSLCVQNQGWVVGLYSTRVFWHVFYPWTSCLSGMQGWMCAGLAQPWHIPPQVSPRPPGHLPTWLSWSLKRNRALYETFLFRTHIELVGASTVGHSLFIAKLGHHWLWVLMHL